MARYRSVGRAPTARSDVVVGEGCNHEGCEGGLGSEQRGGGAHKVVDDIHVQPGLPTHLVWEPELGGWRTGTRGYGAF